MFRVTGKTDVSKIQTTQMSVLQGTSSAMWTTSVGAVGRLVSKENGSDADGGDGDDDQDDNYAGVVSF